MLDLSLNTKHEVSRFGAIRDFTGAQNFINVFQDPVFLASVRRTIIWTVCVVGGTVLISVPVALILNQDFHGRGVARTIVMLPWSVSLTMTAVVWRWAFNDDYGMSSNVTSLNDEAFGVKFKRLPHARAGGCGLFAGFVSYRDTRTIPFASISFDKPASRASATSLSYTSSPFT